MVDGQFNLIPHTHIATHATGHGGQRVMRIFVADNIIMMIRYQRVDIDDSLSVIVDGHRACRIRRRGIPCGIMGGNRRRNIWIVFQPLGINLDAIAQRPQLRQFDHRRINRIAVNYQVNDISLVRVAAHRAADDRFRCLQFSTVQNVITRHAIDGDRSKSPVVQINVMVRHHVRMVLRRIGNVHGDFNMRVGDQIGGIDDNTVAQMAIDIVHRTFISDAVDGHDQRVAFLNFAGHGAAHNRSGLMLLVIIQRVVWRNVVDCNRRVDAGIDHHRGLSIGRRRVARNIGGANGGR